MIRKLTTVAALIVLISATSAFARPDKSWKNWFGHVAGGYTMAQGRLSDFVDDDYTLNGGATYWPSDWPVGLSMDLAYNDMDISREALDFINNEPDDDDGEITGGGVEIWQFTTNAMWAPQTKGPVSFYVTGGIGVYSLEGKLTNTGLVYYPPICSPWWWGCIPGGVGPGTIVQARQRTTEFGWNAGVGLTFEKSSGSQWFLEARFHSVDTSDESTEFVPFVIGYRW